MSTSPQQPPLRPSDRVRYIHDQGHLEVVESCEFAAEALIPHWQVVTTWDGNRRIADAAEFVIEEGAMMRRIARRLRALWHRREIRWALADVDELATLRR